MMDDLTTNSFDDFLDMVASRTPTPGGGGAAAAAGALAAAMARMVTAYSLTKKTNPDVRANIEASAKRLQRIDHLLRALISEDADAYSAMTAAASQNLQGDSESRAHHQQTVLQAIAVPMEIAALASDMLTTLNEFKPLASKNLVSDLGVAAALALAAAQAASYSVRVNLHEIDHAPTRRKLATEMERVLERGRSQRESLDAFVHDRLEQRIENSR